MRWAEVRTADLLARYACRTDLFLRNCGARRERRTTVTYHRNVREAIDIHVQGKMYMTLTRSRVGETSSALQDRLTTHLFAVQCLRLRNPDQHQPPLPLRSCMTSMSKVSRGRSGQRGFAKLIGAMSHLEHSATYRDLLTKRIAPAWQREIERTARCDEPPDEEENPCCGSSCMPW